MTRMPITASALKDRVSECVSVGRLDQGLKYIHDFVERIFTEPLCTSQVFGSKDLDDLCQQIGKINLETLQQKNIADGYIPSHPPIYIYIVTNFQKSGGHNRVIESFIRARPEAVHTILSTELAGKSDSNYFLNQLAKPGSINLELAPKGNFQQRLTWLQKRLLSINPKKVFLFNHHQDSVAVAAVQPAMNLSASFYHHGDHHLCLGLYLPHFEHIDPHPMGYHNCRDTLGIENIYVPLTVEDRGNRSSNVPFLQTGNLVTCTAARSNKIEIPYFVSYIDLIPKLLKATGGTHVHIGRLTPWALFKIRRGLKKLSIEPNRFIYKAWVPSVWQALQDSRVDLYIASFPYGGGLTLIEAMGAGTPVALHKHVFSRLLSGIDLAYPGAFNWRQPEALLQYCALVTPEALTTASRQARQQYEQFHSVEHLHAFMNAEHQATLVPNATPINFMIDSDEWASWVERQLSIRHVLARATYRVLRKLRARWM
jgi:glycosyltransferase involved in cell wall biosynthesis